MALPMSIARMFPSLKPERTQWTPLTQQDSAAAATAQTFTFDVPRDKLIHAVLVEIGEDTTATATEGTLADDLTDIQFVANGNKYIKDLKAAMAKEIAIMNLEVLSTGYYKLFFTDPKVTDAKPLPSWIFTTLKLILKDNAPAASNYHHIRVSLLTSDRIEDISGWRILHEKYLQRKAYGTGTGYKEYEHERAYKVLAYLYAMDDNETLSNTKFDKVKLLGLRPDREDRILDETYIPHIREQNKIEYQNAHGTGYMSIVFGDGYETGQYTSLKSYLNIPTAGTDIGLRVLERYLL